MQLLLVENGAHPRRFAVGTTGAADATDATAAAGTADATSATAAVLTAPLVALLPRCRYASVRAVC